MIGGLAVEAESVSFHGFGKGADIAVGSQGKPHPHHVVEALEVGYGHAHARIVGGILFADVECVADAVDEKAHGC